MSATTSLAGLSSEAKRNMLARLIQTKSQQCNFFPLSFAQQRLWFIGQLEPGSAVYNIPEVWQLTGTLDLSIFQQCANEIIKRHDILRTTFGAADGEAFQAVMPFQAVPIPLLDLSNSANPEQDARRFVQQEVRRPFDLQKGPLLRIQLLRLESEEHIAVVTMHHIISDAGSFDIFRREMAALYRAFLAGKPSPLPELPIQYADFAQWQRGQLKGQVVEEQLTYWKQQLAGPLPQLELPASHPRPAVQTFRGASQSFLFSNSLTDSLKALSRAEGVTLFMTLLAAFKTLLYRYTRQEDITVGTPISGRSRVETEGLIGLFVNTLALRTSLGGDPPFRELLGRIREVTLGAYAHQEMPFEWLVKELQPERSLKQNPLFQVVLGFQGSATVDCALGDVSLSFMDSDLGASKFDWTLLFKETTKGLEGYFEYNTDVYDSETISRAIRHFQTLLEGIVTAPEKRISQLPLLTESETRELLVDWNNTKTNYERDASIQQVFEAQVAKNPDAVALRFESRDVTYRELNERANQLAHYLKKFHVGPDALVGLCLERSIEMVVAILAILKAGGAYVPFDRSYPRERLAQMFEATRFECVLTNTCFDEKNLPAGRLKIVCLETDWPLIARESRDNPVNATKPENLAYVMFTSGSTGKPKATAIPHRAVVRLVRNTNYANFSADDVFFQFAPISFDASTFEIFGALLNGAKLVIYPPHMPSLEELGAAIRTEKVTTLWLTAGLFHQMVEQQLGDLKGVRQLLAGGDVLSVPHVLSALRELNNCQLINGYGPTETCTFACCYRVPPDWRGERSLPIGGPISNSQVYILDDNLSPVPVGIPGELYIGGDGVGRGYLNDAQLTAQKFISNPFTVGVQALACPTSAEGTLKRELQPSETLYKTGDLVRYLPDGNIEFIGRRDFQVKIRGFRVELGEIESALAQHAKVAEVIVIARQKNDGEKQIVAYIVPRAGTNPQAAELRKYLEQKLPLPALPSHFVLLERLPLTANGKVDRRALPEPTENSAVLFGGEEAPQSEIESALAKIWSEVLGVNRIGRNDNFFELGGHSLLVTRVVSRVRKSFQVEISIRNLFEQPTIAALAQIIEELLIKQISELTEEEVLAATQS